MFKFTKHLIALLVFVGLLACVQTVSAQEQTKDTTEIVQNDSVTADSAMAVIDADLQGWKASWKARVEDCTSS